MICYAQKKEVHAISFIQKSDPLLELLGKEGTQLREQVDNLWKDPEPIQRLLEIETRRHLNHQSLILYLEKLRNEALASDEADFPVDVLDVAEKVWKALSKHFYGTALDLAVPDACPGNQNNFMYTWIKDEHYLECEFFSNGNIEFFYRQKNTGEIWGEDTTLEHTFSETIFKKVALFAQTES